MFKFKVQVLSEPIAVPVLFYLAEYVVDGEFYSKFSIEKRQVLGDVKVDQHVYGLDFKDGEGVNEVDGYHERADNDVRTDEILAFKPEVDAGEEGSGQDGTEGNGWVGEKCEVESDADEQSQGDEQADE